MAKRTPTGQTKAAQEKARRQAVDAGLQAKVLAENPLLVSTLEAISRDTFQAFKAATTPEQAWRLKQQFDAAEGFQRTINGYILAGEAAMQLLRREEELQNRTPESYDVEEYRKRATDARNQWNEEHGGPTT